MGGEQRDDAMGQFIPEDYFRELKREAIFGSDRPMEVDVGCGDGGFLIEMAAHHGDRDFLGLERLLGRVRKVCKKAARRGLDNVKVLRLESGYALEYLLPARAFHRLHLLFPDPWPKKRHHARRLVRPDTVLSFARVLEEGGEFLFKTDHEPYFEEVLEIVERSGCFSRVCWEDDAFFYPVTDFEAQWLGQGKAIYRGRFKVSS